MFMPDIYSADVICKCRSNHQEMQCKKSLFENFEMKAYNFASFEFHHGCVATFSELPFCRIPLNSNIFILKSLKKST